MYGFHNPGRTFHDDEEEDFDLTPVPVFIDKHIASIVRENSGDKKTILQKLNALLSTCKDKLTQFAIKEKIADISEPQDEVYEWA